MMDYNIFVLISNIEKFLAEQLTCLNELYYGTAMLMNLEKNYEDFISMTFGTKVQ